MKNQGQQITEHFNGRGVMLASAWLLCIAALFRPGSAEAQSYEGKWNRTFLQFSVTVESWGENCGVMPRSYSSRKVKSTEILQNNGHLFFSTGGLRTDRCNSPNPALVTLATSRSANMWTRTCETPRSVSKFERIDYTFDGDGNSLTYEAASTFDWTLNSDHCAVSWVEKRVYQRTSDSAESVSRDDAGVSPILKVHEDAEFANSTATQAEPQCEPTGKLRRLIIAPQDTTISPSEKLCFQVRGVDATGCRFSVNPRWSVTQNGVSQDHLMDGRGCFTAGDNAAETDGVFQIDAQYKGESVSTTLEISYPDVEDLARARLDMAGEIGADVKASDTVVAVAPMNSDAAVPIQASDKSAPSNVVDPLLLVLLVVAVVVFVVLLVSMVWLLKKQTGGGADAVSDLDSPSVPGVSTRSSVSSGRRPEKICPACNARFPMDAKYCPADASELQVVVGNLRSSIPPPKGMICPTCKRGYDMGSKFCPHDSTPLVEYEKWRRK